MPISTTLGNIKMSADDDLELNLDYLGIINNASKITVRHRVQKTGKSRSLKKFGYTQDNALLFRPNCCPLLVHL